MEPLISEFHTLGCKLNQAETGRIAKLLGDAGISREPLTLETRPYLIYVNSCAVTEKAATKSRHLISKLARDNRQAMIIVGGCLSQLDPLALARIPGVGYVLGTEERFTTDWWRGIPEQPIVAAGGIRDQNHPIQTAVDCRRARPFLKIQDGCDQGCSYCIIPQLRGKPRSVPLNEVLNAARSLIDSGVYEIVLTGVRIGSWGRDLPEHHNLAFLLWKLLEIPGEYRIRLGSLEPWELDEELITLITTNDAVCPHLHIPIQHTSPAILELMGRPQIQGTIERLRQIGNDYPHLAIGADLIAGFPGETESDFNRLRSDLMRIPLAYSHIFGYSSRPGTRAPQLPNPVPHAEKKRRREILLEAGRRKRADFVRRQNGVILQAIPDADRKSKPWTPAVTENYLHLPIPSTLARPGKPTRIRLESSDSGKVVGVMA